jgi:hypothetical protein
MVILNNHLRGIVLICLVPLVGGNWSNTANAGVFYLNLNNVRSNSNNNVGGRDCYFNLKLHNEDTGVRGIQVPAVSEIYRGGLFE